jgi:hypothetical protein
MTLQYGIGKQDVRKLAYEAMSGSAKFTVFAQRTDGGNTAALSALPATNSFLMGGKGSEQELFRPIYIFSQNSPYLSNSPHTLMKPSSH